MSRSHSLWFMPLASPWPYDHPGFGFLGESSTTSFWYTFNSLPFAFFIMSFFGFGLLGTGSNCSWRRPDPGIGWQQPVIRAICRTFYCSSIYTPLEVNTPSVTLTYLGWEEREAEDAKTREERELDRTHISLNKFHHGHVKHNYNQVGDAQYLLRGSMFFWNLLSSWQYGVLGGVHFLGGYISFSG